MLSAFEVITETRHINYLLTYLLTYASLGLTLAGSKCRKEGELPRNGPIAVYAKSSLVET